MADLSSVIGGVASVTSGASVGLTVGGIPGGIIGAGIGAGVGIVNSAGRSGEGKANSTADGFIGVNTGAARDYVRDICGTAIKAAIKAAKDTKALFNVFEDGWEGQSLANFKSNFATAVLALEKSLAKAFAALVKQIAAITDAMVDQDINMVERH